MSFFDDSQASVAIAKKEMEYSKTLERKCEKEVVEKWIEKKRHELEKIELENKEKEMKTREKRSTEANKKIKEFR